MKRLWLILPVLLFFQYCDEPKPEDCFGVAGGEAFIDDCGQCTGGTTGLEPNNTGCTVSDIDGNIYEAILIGDQLWMKENLKTTHYSDGDMIPRVYSGSEWTSLTTGAYAVYGDVEKYGKLYNWYAVNDSRGLCPEEWHAPSDDEWQILVDYLGGENIAGGKLKDTQHWDSPNTGANNESGFSALPGGMRAGHYLDEGIYIRLNQSAYFWSTKGVISSSAVYQRLYYNSERIDSESNKKAQGSSVRCLKD